MAKIKLYGKKKPHPWQKETHDYIKYLLSLDKDDPLKTVVIKAARQKYGKSYFDRIELVRFSLGYKNLINGYISPTFRLAKESYDKIVKGTRAHILRKDGKNMEIEYKTGSVIKFFSAEQGEALRGFTITGILVVDEAVVIADNSWTELIKPWTLVHNPVVLITSTPKYKVGFFYDLYHLGLTDNPTTKTFDWVRDYPVDESDPKLIDAKSQMPGIKYRAEYLGQFVDGEGTVFGDFKPVLFPVDEIPGIKEGDKLYVGIDWALGKGQDYTVVSILNEKGFQVELEYFNDKSPENQVQIIAEILKDLKINFGAVIRKCYAENNSLGSVYLDMLQNALKLYAIEITPFATTEESKRELIENFQVSIEQRLIHLLDIPEQVNQLGAFESKIKPITNKISYGARSGQHDDIVIADALAWQALKDKDKEFGGFTIIEKEQ